MSNRLLTIALCVGALACGTSQTPVRVTSLQPFTNKDPTGGRCEARGEAEGLGTSETEARADLRQQARAVGADTVLIDQPVGKAPGRRTLLHAQLLKCADGQPEEPKSATPAASEQSLEERLAELKRLHDKGLITEEDYDARRKELLQEL